MPETFHKPGAGSKTPLSRLPWELREELCRRLRDGATWRSIAAWLDGLGHSGINAQNVTNFRKGAYARWLKDQDKIDAIRDRAEAINREIAAGGYTALDKMIMDVAGALADSDLPADQIARAAAALKTAVTGAGRLDVMDRRARLAEDALALEREKFAAAQRRAGQADAAEGVARDTGLSDEEKQARIRRIFGLE